jgi:hypothetical protein
MTWTSRRTNLSLLLVVVAVPVLVFGLLALLRHTQIQPIPTATPGIPLLQGEACGLSPTTSPSSTSMPVPTLGPRLPTPREGGAIGYDSVANDVVMLGGQTFSANGGASQPLNDSWTLDSQGWHQDHLVPSPTPGAMAEDPRTGHLIMVGSPLPSGEAQQTWSWDGNAWTRLADLPAATDRTVGLAPLAGQLVLVTENSQVTGTQTWAWTGVAWSLRHPATNLPLGAAGPVISADPLRHRVIAVLAAAATSGGSTQAWAWDGSTWRLVSATFELGLDPISATMAPDPQTGAVLLFMHPAGSVACTWALSGATWREVNPSSPDVDTAFGGASLLSDTHIGRLILIGGAARPNPLNVLWVLIGSVWRAEPSTFLGPSGSGQFRATNRLHSDG